MTYSEIAELFDEAEQSLKLAEHTLYELSIPAVNELRYAGRHIVEALKADENGKPNKAENERNKAAKHCKRAIYDCQEARALFFFEQYYVFRQDYRRVVISAVVSSYSELKTEIARWHKEYKALDFDSREDRDKYVGFMNGLCSAVEPIVEQLEESRDELNKTVYRQRRNLSLTVVSILIGAIGLWWTISSGSSPSNNSDSVVADTMGIVDTTSVELFDDPDYSN